jgi:hypothetical protein
VDVMTKVIPAKRVHVWRHMSGDAYAFAYRLVG